MISICRYQENYIHSHSCIKATKSNQHVSENVIKHGMPNAMAEVNLANAARPLISQPFMHTVCFHSWNNIWSTLTMPQRIRRFYDVAIGRRPIYDVHECVYRLSHNYSGYASYCVRRVSVLTSRL